MIRKEQADLNKQIQSSKLFMDLLVGIMREHSYLPVEGSPASEDNAQAHYREAIWQGELHEQSDVQAQMSLLASIQDLSLAVEDSGRRPSAFIVLLRASLEAASLANFLTSASIDSVAERARRGLNEMLDGCYQQWKALDQYEQSADAAAKLTTMNKWLEVASSYHELGRITRAHERRRHGAPYVGDQRPTISSLIDDLFFTGDDRRFGRWLYSAVSAPAHSSAHGFAISGGQRLAPDGTQTVDQEAHLAEDRVARFAITGLSAIATAVKAGGLACETGHHRSVLGWYSCPATDWSLTSTDQSGDPLDTS
jgi:hypothetical protein